MLSRFRYLENVVPLLLYYKVSTKNRLRHHGNFFLHIICLRNLFFLLILRPNFIRDKQYRTVPGAAELPKPKSLFQIMQNETRIFSSVTIERPFNGSSLRGIIISRFELGARSFELRSFRSVCHSQCLLKMINCS